jgi:hypothetical protein
MIKFKHVHCLLFLLHFLNSAATDIAQNYDSGRSRVATIMCNDETGIAAYNRKKITYAESKNLAEDLNLTEIVHYFGCKTVIGQSFMAQTLLCPVSTEDRDTILARRQNAIRLLVENSDLRQQVGTLLDKAQQEEQEVVKLMSEFFMGQSCPELANLELIKKENPWIYPLVNFLSKNPTGKTIGTSLALIGTLSNVAFTSYYGKAIYEGNYDSELIAWTTFFGLATAFDAYSQYKDYTQASEKRNKIHALNQLISIAEAFEEICICNSIEAQFTLHAITNADGLRLIEKIKHARYKDKNTLVFFTPAAHTFLYEIYQQDKYLSSLFACIAEMDVYHAIATKIVESQKQKNKICFVSYLDNAKPTIQAEGFWSVLVENAVSNDLAGTKNILLTGPNAGGKSTAIKALLQNILLGQSFGVAAAEKFEFTMFDVIHSYLHISDDLINGLSLFASEIKRAKEVLQRINVLAPGKKFFFALDELFTGTVAEDGEKCAFSFVQKIAKFENVLFVYATHFNKLKELGNNDGYCNNYKVDAPVKNSAGKLVYPFTLSMGASQVNVALDMAREAGLFE